MIKFVGVEYSRAATAKIIHDGPALAPRAVQKMFPKSDWTIITPDDISDSDCMADRFGDAFNVHKKIYAKTPTEKHIFIGGDHSVNFSHFAAIIDYLSNFFPDTSATIFSPFFGSSVFSVQKFVDSCFIQKNQEFFGYAFYFINKYFVSIFPMPSIRLTFSSVQSLSRVRLFTIP